MIRAIFNKNKINHPFYKLYLQPNKYIRKFSNWKDPLNLEIDLTEEEKLVKHTTKSFCEKELMPRIISDTRNEYFNKEIIKKIGDLGLFEITLNKENSVSYGLICREIERIDSSFRSAFSVQSSLVIYPINHYGSKYQREKYLNDLINGTKIGCFGLTEPNHGSDPSSMETKAKLKDDYYILNGSKSWITNSPIADIFLVWAKDVDSNKIRGFILDRDFEGLSTPKINGKYALKASETGYIILENVKVPLKNCLPNIEGLKGPFSCLNKARYGISWGALGSAEFCFELVRDYTLSRQQFGKPLASNQLIQKKLADMQIDIALGLNSCLKVGNLIKKGLDDNVMISILKKNSCEKSINICRNSRDILGANGISDEYHVIRHLNNLEAVNTYEGTSDIHSLIIGKSITNISAF
jgi:glutaryl-CoA dehydrogenase